MPPDWLIYVAIGAIALLAGFIHSAIGFGFGIVAVTLLPLVAEVKQAHIVISTASFPVLLMAAWAYRQGADRKVLLHALIGAAIGMPAGLFAFEKVSPSLLIRITGVAILGMVWMSFRNRRMAAAEVTESGGSAGLAGLFGGFLAGAVSIAGPPVAAFALGQGWKPERFKAFINQFLLIVSLYKIFGMSTRGMIDRDVLTEASLLAPMAIIGIQLGAFFSRRLSTRLFQVFVAFTLTLIALKFLVLGS